MTRVLGSVGSAKTVRQTNRSGRVKVSAVSCPPALRPGCRRQLVVSAGVRFDATRGENRLHEAIEIFKQGLVIDSEAKDLFNGLGGAYSELGRHDEAIAMFQRYVQLAPVEANAHDSLGMGYQWAGRYDEAVQEYERALALKADFYISVMVKRTAGRV